MDPTTDTLAGLAIQPEPTKVRRRPVVRLPQLLNLVLRLIAHGEDLVATLPQRAAEPGFARTAGVFGSNDIGTIAICLRRGILRATALCEMLARREARGLDVPLPTLRLPRRLRAAAATVTSPAKPAAWWFKGDLGYLPAQDEIDDELRRRALGPLLADICLDLGISWETAETLWFELNQSVTLCGGSGLALLVKVLERLGEIPPGLLANATSFHQRRAAARAQAAAEAAAQQPPLPQSPPDQHPTEHPQPASAPCAAAERPLSPMPCDTESSMHWPLNPIGMEKTAALGAS